MSPRHAIIAATIFDGTKTHRDHAVLLEGTQILDTLPRAALPPGIPARVLPPGLWLAPGFIDVQVNGGGDVLFNDAPSVEGVRAIAAAHRRFGTTALLPTLISTDDATMERARAAIDEAVDTQPGILGIHYEGPFLSPEKPGVHDARQFRPPTERHAALLSDFRGITLVTLAPERAPGGFIRRLTNAGARVALGHSNATHAETIAAFGEGLSAITHLFNAMRPLSAREPGPAGAALDNPDCFCGIIADGEHVAPAMLRLAFRGRSTPMLVTDAMPPVGGTRAHFTLAGKSIELREGRVTTADGVLAGSALDMASAVRNAVRLGGVTLQEALRFASLNPARFLGLDAMLGRLASGTRADMVAFDPETLRAHATWVAGEILLND